MFGADERYFIIDTAGNYYTYNRKTKRLSRAKDSKSAETYSLYDANSAIGGGKKAHFYTTLRADDIEVEDTKYIDQQYDEIEKPTLYDGLQNNWEEYISKLCYMSSHIEEYQNNLNEMLSDVDKEICDIMHYLEFSELSDDKMIKTTRLLQDARRRRRSIKDEMEKTSLMKATFLDKEFSIKIHQSLEMMEKMKDRKYTPRKLTELFDEAV